jgi:hypothetical protein
LLCFYFISLIILSIGNPCLWNLLITGLGCMLCDCLVKI